MCYDLIPKTVWTKQNNLQTEMLYISHDMVHVIGSTFSTFNPVNDYLCDRAHNRYP